MTNVVRADFDDDGTVDTAILLVAGGDAAAQLAICLERATEPRLFVIPDPYCADGISVTRKGRTDHDYEANRPVTYATNGVHTYCFEKAGATYVFTKGRWVRIVDSD